MASQLGAIYANRSYAEKFPFRIPEEIKLRAMVLNCGMYDLLSLSKEPWNREEELMDNYVLMETYLGKEGRLNEERLSVVENIDIGYPPCFIMTSYYDFLKDCAKPFYELLGSKGIEAVYRMYGEQGQKYMGHVFHCNMNLEEARQCNIDECDFMKKYVRTVL